MYGKRNRKHGDGIIESINGTAKRSPGVGIIGGTGSGKSSVVNLIPRFYDATKGSVQIGGKDVREYSLEELRGKIGMVLQKAVLFKGTIRENMLWGNENATDDAIMQALEVAQAKEFVDKKEGGLDFEIEQGGKNLSGGQRQRAAIARGLAMDPEFLIADEPVSSLDAPVQMEILRLLKQLRDRRNLTLLIISHDIPMVEHISDRIIRMEKEGLRDEFK